MRLSEERPTENFEDRRKSASSLRIAIENEFDRWVAKYKPRKKELDEARVKMELDFPKE